MEVLFEKCEDGISYGYTSEYVPVAAEGMFVRGAITRVIGTGTCEHRLICTEVNHEAE